MLFFGLSRMKEMIKSLGVLLLRLRILFLQDIVPSMALHLSKWFLCKKEFSNVKLDDIAQNWKPCMVCGLSKGQRVVSWRPPPLGTLKFNVDSAARGKLGPTGMGGVLRNCKGEVLFLFSKHVGVKDSNEAGTLTILEALHSYSSNFLGELLVESDSHRPQRHLMGSSREGPWKFQFIFNDIKSLSSSIQLTFIHVSGSANIMADDLAKQGVGRIFLLRLFLFSCI